MHFFKYFCVFFLPIFAMAVPAPDAAAIPDFESNAGLNLAKLATSLQARQNNNNGGGDGLLGDLLDSFGNIGDLLNAETFKEIDIILKNLAKVLDDEGTKKAKNLVNNANDLLTPELVKQAKGLISDVAPLISSVSQLISAIISSLFGKQG